MYAQKIVADTVSRSIHEEIKTIDGNTPAEQEFAIIYAQIVQITYHMINMLWPLDKKRFAFILKDKFALIRPMHEMRSDFHTLSGGHEGSGANGTNGSGTFDSSKAGNSSMENRSIMGKQKDRREAVNEKIIQVIKKFIDDICSRSDLGRNSKTKQLLEMIPDFVYAQNSTLLEITKITEEYKKSHKVNSELQIKFLNGEVAIPEAEFGLQNGVWLENTFENSCQFLMEDLNSSKDNRSNKKNNRSNKNYQYMKILPARGKIILTNYRLIFQGNPEEANISDRDICIAVSIGSITKIYPDLGEYRNPELKNTYKYYKWLRIRALNSLPLIFRFSNKDDFDKAYKLLENLSLTAECYHQFASTHMITQNSITSRSPTQKASILNDSFEDLDTVPELSESSNGPSTPKDLSFTKTPGSAHTIGSNHDIYKLANTMANNNNNIRKKGIKHTLMRGFKNTALHKKTTAYQTKKEQKRLLKGLNDVGQNNSTNNANDPISSNNIPENEEILKYKQEISSKLGQIDLKRMEKRCYSSYNQVNDRYLEVDRENQSFLRVPSYPWFSIRIKDNHFYQNVLANHYDFNKLFKASRYPVYKFCLPETGIFITSAKFQSEIFDLLEKKVARLKGSSINKNIQDQDTSNSSNNPGGAAIKTKLFSKQDKYKIYIEILERFYLQICDQKSKKILIVINKSHAAHKRREWNFTQALKSGGSGRGLFIQGIKFYTSKSIDDIFQKFDRSLRPFPGEKFAKQKDLSNARIANQESYNYLQTNGYGNLEASSQVQQDFGSEGGISSEDLNSNNNNSNYNYHNGHGNHKTIYTGMPHMRVQPIDHQDFNNNRTRISNNNRDYKNYRSYSDQYLYSNLDPEYFQIINDILHDSHRLSKALEEFSIHLAIENEADYSAIISSLVNIFADQKMRTIDGLIEIVYREFILAGHRFKANHNRQNFILAPIFLVFLDCVHQLWVTNRSKFEFNQRFLETLAYHSYSRRFPDFMFDNEKERLINLKNLCRTDHHLNNFRNFLDINRDLYYNQYYQSSLNERNITKSFVGHISPNPISIDQYNHQSKDPTSNSNLSFYDSLKQSGHKLKIFSFWINTHLVSYDYYDIMLSLENTEDLVSEVQKQTANLNSSSSKRNKNNILTSHSTDSHFATRKLNYGSEENSRNESYYNDLLVAKRHLLEKLELKKLELRKTQNLQLSSHEDQETLFSPTARRSFPHESTTKQNSKLLNLQKTPENLEIGLSNKKSANSAAKYINYENLIRNSVHEKINSLKCFSRKLSLSWHTTRWHNNKYLIEKNRGGTIFDSASQFSGNTRITSKQSYGYTITNSSIDY